MGNGQWHVGEKFFRPREQCYFVKVTSPNGKRKERRLHPDAKQADTLRCELVVALKRTGVPTADGLVRDLVFRFLDYTKLNNGHKTYVWYRDFLKSFCNTLPPNLKVSSLKPCHAQAWLSQCYPSTGNPNTRRGAISSLKRVFNWAINDMGYLDSNPFAKLKKPAAVPRQTFLTRTQWDEVLALYKEGDPFRDFLQVMLLTGCRPQEARIVEARHINWETSKINFQDGEVPGKQGAREILLSPEAIAILKKWTAKYPKGPILRNQKGRPWNGSALNCRFRRIKKKVSFPVHCYLARHTVATVLLEEGASTGAVAAILGHKDATMVLKVYGKHIEQREQHLRDCLDRMKTAHQPKPATS
jgi:integrase/recombinase XerC